MLQSHDNTALISMRPGGRSFCRIYKKELGMGILNIVAGIYGAFVGHNLEYSVFLFFQGEAQRISQ
eukprot:1185124-Prorocentrum_minimum.AAC.5